MPRIKEYTAADRELSQDSTGFSAFETAGRRIGPAYDQAATSYAKVGRAQAGDIKDRIWPWDILSLNDSQKSSGGSSKKGSGGGGGGMHLSGGANNLYNEKEGGGSGSGGSLGSSRGAAALGKIGSGLATKGYPARQDVQDGQVVYDSRKPASYHSVLEGGELRRIDNKTGKYLDGPGSDNGQADAEKWGSVHGRDTGGSDADYGGDNSDRSYPGSPASAPVGDDYSGGGGWWSGITDTLSSAFGSNKTGGNSEDYGSE